MSNIYFIKIKVRHQTGYNFVYTDNFLFILLSNILSHEIQSPDFKSLYLILRDKRDRVSLSRNRIKDHSLHWRHTNFRLLYVGTQCIFYAESHFVSLE